MTFAGFLAAFTWKPSLPATAAQPGRRLDVRRRFDKGGS